MPGFEFTPGGIVEIGGGPVNAAEVAAPVVPAPSDRPPPARETATADARKRPAKDAPLTGRQILAMVRTRLKEIERQLAAVPALEKERASLQAVLAASQKAARAELAPVRLLKGS